jgi:hypothetical protein
MKTIPVCNPVSRPIHTWENAPTCTAVTVLLTHAYFLFMLSSVLIVTTVCFVLFVYGLHLFLLLPDQLRNPVRHSCFGSGSCVSFSSPLVRRDVMV